KRQKSANPMPAPVPQMLQLLGIEWSHPSDSNRRPFDYESNALPTELGWRSGRRRVSRFGKELRAGLGPKLRIYVPFAMSVKFAATGSGPGVAGVPRCH